MSRTIVKKVGGTDQELGNLYLTDRGSVQSTENCRRAAATVLREIRGYPRPSRVDNKRAYGGHGWGWASDGSRSHWSYDGRGWEREYRQDGPVAHGSSGWSERGYSPDSYYDSDRRYLLNGSCFYEDCQHLEACSPEVLQTSDFVCSSHANYRIADQARDAAQRKLPAGDKIILTADNSDGKGHSWGAHMNVLIRKDLFQDFFRKPVKYLYLVSYQVSSIPLTGLGKVGSENGAPPVDYQISQRADFFEQLMSYPTTYARGLVNQRNEPLAGGASDLSRLHVIFYDANLAHLSLYLRAGMLQLLLAAMEADALNNAAVLLDDPLDALCRWSHDPSLDATARSANGAHLTAVELQALFLEQIKPFVESGECDEAVPEARRVLRLWEQTITMLQQRDWTALAQGGLDWVLKAKILLRAMESRPELDWQSDEIKYLDHAYSNLDRAEGLYWACEASGEVDRMVSEEEIQGFVEAPPEDTRAWGRCALLQRAEEEGIEVTDVDWDRLSFRSGSGRSSIDLGDPRRSTREELEPLLDSVASLEDITEGLDPQPLAGGSQSIH